MAAPGRGHQPSPAFLGQGLEPAIGLPAHVGRRGAALADPALHGAVDREHREHILGDAFLDRLHGGKRQLVQGDLLGGRLGHDPPGHVMGLAERHLEGAHQPVGEIRGGGVTLSRRGPHPHHVGRQVAHHARHRGDRQRERGERVDGAFLVLLHVLRIGERQPLHHDQQRVERADDAPGLGAHQLGRVRVALLRHDRGAGGELVRQRDQADQRRAPDHDLLGEARQMHRGDGGGGERLQHEVAVRDRVERVRHRLVEAERLCGHGAVDWKGGAGERGGAQRRLVRPLARIRKTAAVARRHLHIGEQVVAEGHGLRGLQMGKARHHRRGMLQGLLRQRLLIAVEGLVDGIDGRAHPQPEIGRDLVIARARGVQPPRGRPDQLGEPALHVHMDVFERPLELELAGLDL